MRDGTGATSKKKKTGASTSDVPGGPFVPAKWGSITWNPPLHRGANGAHVGDPRDTEINDAGGGWDRAWNMGTGSTAKRNLRKGVIYQQTSYADMWTYEPANDASAGAGSLLETSGRTTTRYGFRFHYNPSVISYSTAVEMDNTNMATIFSGASAAMPITGTGSSVSFSFYLNRIEDMLLLAPKSVSGDPVEQAYQAALASWQKQVKDARAAGSQRRVQDLLAARPKKSDYKSAYQLVVPKVEELRYFYGQTMSPDDLDGIYQRGTGYDLEFLFRTLLGKPWETLLRGTTADVGMAFGVPLVLDFNAGAVPGAVPHGQRYLGRVTSLNYSHLSFNRRMVPMWTEVNLTFDRYPDITGTGAGSYTVKNPPSASAARGASVNSVQRKINANPSFFLGTTTAPAAPADPYVPYAGGPTNPADGKWGVNWNDPRAPWNDEE